MKHYLQSIVLLLCVLPLLGRSEQPEPQPTIEYQQTRRSSRHHVELKVSVDLAAIGDVSKAENIPVTFTVKNISKEGIAILHIGDTYRMSVEICPADKIDEPNQLFPLPVATSGSGKKIEPGESISFRVDVPVDLFRMHGKKFVAGVRYGTRTFSGEAFSEPFSFPSLK